MFINTLECAKRLEEAGFTRQQAETLTNLIVEIADQRFITKQDVLAIKQDINALEYRLTIRFGSMLACAVLFLVVFISLLK